MGFNDDFSLSFQKNTHLNAKYNSLGSIKYMFKSYFQNKKCISQKYTYFTEVLHIQFLLPMHSFQNNNA